MLTNLRYPYRQLPLDSAIGGMHFRRARGPVGTRMIFTVTTHQQSISIRKSPVAIFDYATSPSGWHEWHSRVKRVDISIEGSAPAGMTFEEDTATIIGT